MSSPESPNFINVPSSLQMGYHHPRIPKGYLPTPKDIFPHNAPHKATPEYIETLYRDRKPSNVSNMPDSKLSEQQLYKRRMTGLRKQHLRTGLTDLQTRKQSQDLALKIRSDTKSAERARLISQAEREDARLTNNSIPSAMNPATNLLVKSKSEEDAISTQKQQNLIDHESQKSDVQKDALHTLYMNARNFITSESQLLSTIEKEFDNQTFGGYAAEPAKNYWETMGPPDGINALVKRSSVGARQKMTPGEKEDAWRRDQERMKRLGEAMSGGKM